MVVAIYMHTTTIPKFIRRTEEAASAAAVRMVDIRGRLFWGTLPEKEKRIGVNL